jgi:hypothetical protein
MKIILSPIASNYTTEVSVDNLTIIIDDTLVDLSVIPVGGYAEPENDDNFIGKVTRDEVVISYHYKSAEAEPSQSTDWADYTFEITSGLVPCPIVWKPIIEEETDV